MMADLVHEDVRDDIPQRFIAIGPVIEYGAAVEEDHVRLAWQITEASPIQAYSLVKAHQIEGICQPQLLKHLVGREVLHPHHDIAADLPEVLRQPLPGLRSQTNQNH